MKRRTFYAATLVVALTLTAQVANAQLFRFGWRSCSTQRYYSACGGGACYRGYWQCAQNQCYTGSCGRATAVGKPSCSNGACQLQQPSCANGACQIQQPSCANGSCQLQEYKIVKNEAGEIVKEPVKVEENDRGITSCPLLQRVNALRARYGLASLANDANLESGSLYQANYCARVGTLIHGSGVAEILAMNGQGIETALNQWLNSPGHRALLLSGRFRYAGVAVYRDAWGRSWCAVRFK